jgi:hypothetical protein
MYSEKTSNDFIQSDSTSTFKSKFKTFQEIDSEREVDYDYINDLIARSFAYDARQNYELTNHSWVNSKPIKPYKMPVDSYKTNSSSLGNNEWEFSGDTWIQCSGHTVNQISNWEYSDPQPGFTERILLESYIDSKSKPNPKSASNEGLGLSYTSQIPQPLDMTDSQALKEFEVEMSIFASNLAPSAALTMMGVINNLIYHALESFGALDWIKTESGGRRLMGILKDGLDKAIDASRKSAFTMVTALKSTIKYISRYWVRDKAADKKEGIKLPSAKDSQTSVFRRIRELSELGLVRYESEYIHGVSGQSRTYTFLDIEKLLVLAEAIERHVGLEALPKHGCAVIRLAHEAVFPGFGYCRDGDPDTKEPEDWESTKEWREHAEWGRRLGRREHFMAVVQKVKTMLRPNAKDKDELDETKFYARSLVEKWPWLKKIDGFQKISRVII